MLAFVTVIDCPFVPASPAKDYMKSRSRHSEGQGFHPGVESQSGSVCFWLCVVWSNVKSSDRLTCVEDSSALGHRSALFANM